jgi:hypothetical protein
MPSLEEPVVDIDKKRIKKLNAKGRLTERLYKEANYDALWDEALKKISEELARKLAEFHKIDFGEDEKGLWFDASIEIIVPPTPASNQQIAAESKARKDQHEWPEVVKKYKEELAKQKDGPRSNR